MDYLERNIKDSYNQKTVLIRTTNTQGSTIIFWMMTVVWVVAAICWRLSQ